MAAVGKVIIQNKELTMSLANELFNGLKAVGQSVGNTLVNDVLPDLAAEARRLGTQGSMELAAALFNGSAFVPYGPGQYTPQPEREAVSEQEKTQEQESGGMSR